MTTRYLYVRAVVRLLFWSLVASVAICFGFWFPWVVMPG